MTELIVCPLPTLIIQKHFLTNLVNLLFRRAPSQLHCLYCRSGLHPRPVPTHRGGGHLQQQPPVRLPLATLVSQPEAGLRLRVGAGHHGHPQDVTRVACQ